MHIISHFAAKSSTFMISWRREHYLVNTLGERALDTLFTSFHSVWFRIDSAIILNCVKYSWWKSIFTCKNMQISRCLLLWLWLPISITLSIPFYLCLFLCACWSFWANFINWYRAIISNLSYFRCFSLFFLVWSKFNQTTTNANALYIVGNVPQANTDFLYWIWCEYCRNFPHFLCVVFFAHSQILQTTSNTSSKFHRYSNGCCSTFASISFEWIKLHHLINFWSI